MQTALEAKVDELLAQKPMPTGSFAEPAQNGFGMPNIGGMLRVSNANLLVIALGVIVSSTVGGFVSSMLPSVSRYATVIAGAILLMVFKSGIARDFGSGVLIGGLAELFSGIGQRIGGAVGGVTGGEFAEVRTTFGGTDGVSVTSPDRRVFS